MLRRCSRSLSRTALAFAIAVSMVAPSVLSAQALRTFTVDDALRVRSASVSAVTDDARWIAATDTDRAEWIGPGSSATWGPDLYRS